MFDTRHALLGYYMPTAFFIRFERDLFDASGRAVTGSLPLFMHEYTHLVQDRSSLYGALDFIHFHDGIQSLTRYVRDSGTEVRLPLRGMVDNGFLPGRGDYCWLSVLERIHAVTNPSDDWPYRPSWEFVDLTVETIDVDYGGQVAHLRRAKVLLYDRLASEEHEQFMGVREVCEAYATAVEMLHGGSTAKAIDGHEYKVVDLILDRRFPGKTPLHTVAICHWALQAPCPAAHFFDLIQHAQSRFHGMLPSPVELYDCCRELTLGKDHEFLLELFGRTMVEIVENQAKGGDNLLSQLYRWYGNTTLSNLRTNADNSRRFPLDTFLCVRSPTLTPEQTTAGLTELFRTIPIPMVERPDGGTVAFGGAAVESEHVFIMRSMTDLLHHLWRGVATQWECPLMKCCKAEMKDSCCTTAPWAKGRIRPSCVYGAAAVCLELERKSFVSAT